MKLFTYKTSDGPGTFVVESKIIRFVEMKRRLRTKFKKFSVRFSTIHFISVAKLMVTRVVATFIFF